MKKIIKSGMLLLIISAVMLVGPFSIAQVQARTLVLGHGAAPGNPRSLAADVFAKLVSASTGGNLTIDIQGSEKLGSDVEMLQAIQVGGLDLTANSQGPLGTFVPEVVLFGLPFLFIQPSDAWALLDGPIGDQMAALCEKKGFKVLAWWDNGIRQVSNNVRPIQKPEDLKGIKLRTPQDPMTIDIFKALGANPTPLAFGELYLALRQGTVDGQENPLVNIWASKLYEVQKYISMTGHKYECTPFIISTNTWKSLSAEEQKAVQSAAKLAGTYQRLELVRQDGELRSKLEAAGVKINDVNKAPFRQATAGVYEQWKAKYPEMVDEIMKARK